MQLRRLVFPAPFGPMIALRAPRATEKLTSETAVTPPKRRATREMSRRGEDIRPKTTPNASRGGGWARGNNPPQSIQAADARILVPYFGASGAVAGGLAGACGSVPGVPGVPGAVPGVPAGCCASCLMLSVIIPIVQPLEESPIATSGVMLRSERGPLVAPTAIAMATSLPSALRQPARRP